MPSRNLKSRMLFGMLWSSIQKFSTMFLTFLSNLVLARILAPEDFGIIGMLAIFIALSNNFIDGGFGAALIQKTDATQKDFSTIFFWNLSLSIFLYAVIWLSARAVASYYGMEILCPMLRVQAITLIINAIGLLQRVRLRKDLEFKKIATVDLISSIFAVTMSIICAYNGLGVWSLIIYQIVLSICQTIGLWLTNAWRPSFIFDMHSFKSLFHYGGFLLISELLNTLCDNIQGLIIGKRFSPAVMGYYSQAKRLEEVPTTSLSYIVAQVSFPVFSEIKADKGLLYATHKKTILTTNFVNIPLMSLLIIVAEPLIVFLFTDKWLDAVPYFRILCFSGLVNCLQSINYQLYLAMGHSKSMFKWNVIKRLLGLTLILLAVPFGVSAILWGMVIGSLFTCIVNAILSGSITGYTLFYQILGLLPTFFISIVTGVIVHFIGGIFNFNYVIVMLIQIILFIVIYLGISFICKIEPAIIIGNLLNQFLGKYLNKR